jgi:hypothetical protein
MNSREVSLGTLDSPDCGTCHAGARHGAGGLSHGWDREWMLACGGDYSVFFCIVWHGRPCNRTSFIIPPSELYPFSIVLSELDRGGTLELFTGLQGFCPVTHQGFPTTSAPAVPGAYSSGSARPFPARTLPREKPGSPAVPLNLPSFSLKGPGRRSAQIPECLPAD